MFPQGIHVFMCSWSQIWKTKIVEEILYQKLYDLMEAFSCQSDH